MNRLDALDQELTHWQAAAAAAQGNIVALYEHPVYRELSGKLPGNPVVLTGDSQVRAAKAVGSIGNLLILASNLGRTIARAAELRRSMPSFFQADQIEEIESLLRGPSVVLSPSDSTPQAARALLDDTDTKPTMLTPAQVLERLQPEFDFARDTIFGVSRAWTDIPSKLDVFEAEITALANLGGMAKSDDGAGVGATLTALKQTAQEARSLLQSDPLRATETLEEILLPRLAAVRVDLEKAIRERGEARGELGAARTLTPQLLEIHAQADAASADCQRKIEIDPRPPQPMDEQNFRALVEWLDRLGGQIEGGGDWRAARIGLRGRRISPRGV